MSVVTDQLEQRGIAFELISHRQAYTSTEEARALGVDAGEVLKTLAVRTSSGYALVVIPASCRLDLHLVRDALDDRHARLASEEELGRDFADYQLGALPPLGALVGASVYVDPEVLRHDTMAFAAGTPDRVGQAANRGAVRRRAGQDRAAVRAGELGARRPGGPAAGGTAERCGRRAASVVTGSATPTVAAIPRHASARRPAGEQACGQQHWQDRHPADRPV
jgi:Ala-tRNA(Pro) deacylase